MPESRWDKIQGKVIAIRFKDSEFALIARRAENNGMAISDYIKWKLLQDHHKGKSQVRRYAGMDLTDLPDYGK